MLPFGMMLKPSMGLDGKASILSAEGSPARTSPMLASEKESQKKPGPVYSMSLQGYAAKWNRDLFSWRTSQASLFTPEPIEYLENWPRWGLMLDGRLYPHPMSELRISGKGSGLWQTPSVEDAGRKGSLEAWMEWEKDGRTTQCRLRNQIWKWPTPKGSASGPDFARMDREGSGGDDLATEVARREKNQPRKWPTPTNSMMTWGDLEQAKFAGNDPKRPKYDKVKFPTPRAKDGDHPAGMSLKRQQEGRKPDSLHLAIGGGLNPMWVEWLMGWPLGWTVLDAVATEWFHNKPSRRGKKS